MKHRRSNNITDWDKIPIKEVVIKLGDFGFSRAVNNSDAKQSLTQEVGTKGYTAPEVGKTVYYHKPADLYSVGVIAYKLAKKEIPSEDVVEKLQKMAKGKKGIEGLTADLLRKDPSVRPTAEEALRRLSKDFS